MYCYKFSGFAANQTEEWIETMKQKIEENLLECKGMDAEQFWHKGYVDWSGYRFGFYEDRIILVNEDGMDKIWKRHEVPSLDVGIISKYVNEFADKHSTWIVLKQEDIHCA